MRTLAALALAITVLTVSPAFASESYVTRDNALVCSSVDGLIDAFQADSVLRRQRDVLAHMQDRESARRLGLLMPAHPRVDAEAYGCVSVPAGVPATVLGTMVYVRVQVGDVEGLTMPFMLQRLK